MLEAAAAVAVVLGLWMLGSISRKLRVISWYLLKMAEKQGALDTPPIHPKQEVKE